MALQVETSEIQPAGLKDEQTVDEAGRELFADIEGAQVVRVNPIADGRGSLTPFLSLAESFWSEPVVYSYAVMMRPGVIKGWGMHRLQTDRYFVPPVQVRVVMYDGRVDSPTFQRYQEVWFSESSGGLVRIPAGVWHADQNWGKIDATLLNFPTHPYDPVNPDKYRLDPRGSEIPFDWTIRDG